MEDDGIFYGHLVHFTVFCYILSTFGIVRGNLVYFFPFWYFVPRKIWQPWRRSFRVSNEYASNQFFCWMGKKIIWENFPNFFVRCYRARDRGSSIDMHSRFCRNKWSRFDPNFCTWYVKKIQRSLRLIMPDGYLFQANIKSKNNFNFCKVWFTRKIRFVLVSLCVKR
jgi:hypothetical protein